MPVRDLVEKRFGKLVVESRAENNKHRQAMWNCICDCGNRKVVNGGALCGGHSKSCGCLISERAGVLWKVGFGDRARSLKDATIRAMFLQCRSGAKARDLEFRITEAEFLGLCTMRCSYCGCQPKEATYRTSKKFSRKRVGTGVYAHGVDRVNNSIGYVLDNLVPCCFECNKMKGTMDSDRFKGLINRQYTFMFNKSKETYMGLDTQDISYMEAA